MTDWINSLPVISSDDPSVINFKNPNPAPPKADVRQMSPPLDYVIDFVKKITSEIKALIVLHPDAVRDHLLVDSEARNVLNKLLRYLAKDEELGDKLRELNSIRYLKTPEEQVQS